MFKSFVKCLAFTTLALGAVPAAHADPLPPGSWEPVAGDPNYVKSCDASACYYYWNTGDNNWVLTHVEPRTPPGGRHEN